MTPPAKTLDDVCNLLVKIDGSLALTNAEVIKLWHYARETRVDVEMLKRSKGRSEPPRKFDPSASGSMMVVDGHPVPMHVYQAILVAKDDRELAENVRGVARFGQWAAKNVLVLVLAAVLLGYLARTGIAVLRP